MLSPRGSSAPSSRGPLFLHPTSFPSFPPGFCGGEEGHCSPQVAPARAEKPQFVQGGAPLPLLLPGLAGRRSCHRQGVGWHRGWAPWRLVLLWAGMCAPGSQLTGSFSFLPSPSIPSPAVPFPGGVRLGLSSRGQLCVSGQPNPPVPSRSGLCSGIDCRGCGGAARLESDHNPRSDSWLPAACGHHCRGGLPLPGGLCGLLWNLQGELLSYDHGEWWCQGRVPVARSRVVDWKADSCAVPLQFAIFLSLIMLVEVAAAIAGYVFRDKVMSEFNKDFRQQMQNYSTDNQTALILDRMQKDFTCCGAANYTDWATIPGMTRDRVPDSCCVNVTSGCGVKFNVKDIYVEGCVEKIGLWLRKNVLVVAAAALGIAFVEVLGIVFACCLVKSIRSGYEVM
uniref:CD63 antigen n=1 Tax=Oryctolagus cuniculus TaxID=9986 RepID=A0A5F9CXZ7_RABIT